MNILIVSGGIPTESEMLSGIFAFDQAKALCKSGIKINFLVVDLRSIRHLRKWGIYTHKKEKIDCAVISIPVGAIPLSLRCKIGSVALKKLYRKVYGKQKPDIIHAHFTDMGSMAEKLAKEIEVPFIITEHSSAIRSKTMSKEVEKCAKEAYRSANLIISVSNALARDIKEKIGFDSKIVPNIIDTNTFRYIVREDENKFGIITVGNLVEIKNQWLLLEAFLLFHKQYPKSYLGIVGEGALKKELVSFVYENDLEENVMFYGAINRKEIALLFGKYDVFAFPSKSETFGVACVEAMCAGLPVIATRCGGPEDFITQENGLIVKNNNIIEFAEALEYIYLNIDKYDRRKISEYACDRFSPDAVSDSLIKIYDCILAKRKCSTLEAVAPVHLADR